MTAAGGFPPGVATRSAGQGSRPARRVTVGGLPNAGCNWQRLCAGRAVTAAGGFPPGVATGAPGTAAGPPGANRRRLAQRRRNWQRLRAGRSGDRSRRLSARRRHRGAGRGRGRRFSAGRSGHSRRSRRVCPREKGQEAVQQRASRPAPLEGPIGGNGLTWPLAEGR